MSVNMHLLISITESSALDMTHSIQDKKLQVSGYNFQLYLRKVENLKELSEECRAEIIPVIQHLFYIVFVFVIYIIIHICLLPPKNIKK